MNIIEMREMVSEDLRIDKSNIQNTIVMIPQLTSKYITMVNEEMVVYKALELEENKIRAARWNYWLYEADKHYDNPVIRDVLIPADEEMVEIKSKLAISKAKLELLEAATKGVNNMGFGVKNFIDMEKFTQGVY